MRTGHQSITIELDGKRADLIENEAGPIRIQRVPPTERYGRVHSSTVTVAVTACDEAAETVYDKRTKDDFEITWFNGTVGAGGQNHQKTQNCCRLKHIPTGIVKTAQTRSRLNSLQNATEALHAELDRHKGIATAETDRAITRDQVGSGKKSDKRRTVRVRDDAVLDHITGKRMTYERYMAGHMDQLWNE